MDRPLLTIVTVNFNNKSQLFQTVNSVVYWKNDFNTFFEYIVVDGDSEDLDECDKVLLNKKCNKFICESDAGIYDAMNKGLKNASGEYIYYLNSGDFLINLPIIIEKIKFEIQNCTKRVLVFRTLQTYKNIGWKRPKLSKLDELKSDQIAHQGAVIPLYEKFNILFDTSRSISADSIWIKKCIDSRSMQAYKQIVAIFQLGGVSNRASLRDQINVYREEPSLKNLAAIFIKPVLINILGPRFYYKFIYNKKYEYIPNLYIYLTKTVEESLLKLIGYKKQSEFIMPPKK